MLGGLKRSQNRSRINVMSRAGAGRLSGAPGAVPEGGRGERGSRTRARARTALAPRRA